MLKRALVLSLLLASSAGCDKKTEPAATPDPATPDKTPATAAEPTAQPAPAAPSGLLAVGAPAPAIKATAHNGESVDLSALRGKPVVVYFYPKDDTPGCTVEAQGIRDEWPELSKTGAVVIGVSTDDNESHKSFAEKHQLPFLLLPDPDAEIAGAFGVPVERGYAKRVTFVIDKEGKIAKVFPQVTPKGHAEELLEAVRGLS